MASLRLLVVCGMLAAAGAVHAQSTTPGGMPPPPGMSLAESAAMRFPQPVRTGDLPDREVLRPVESQDVLGRVRRLVRDANGQIMVVVDFGGFLGFGSRPIAVPVDAMVLLGQDMEIVAFRTTDDYPSSIDMATALHPQTLLALKYGDDTLADPFGYPVRLRMATKLGYKNPKWITAIEVTNTYPGGFWEAKGFPWFAGL